MKKHFLLLAFFFALAISCEAQIIYSNTFDGGLNGMTIMDMDGNEPHPYVSEFGGTWSNLDKTRFDEYPSQAAISASYYQPFGKSDDWLITPAINIPETAVMTWDGLSLDNQNRDAYEVLVSTTDNSPSSFTEVLFKVEKEENVLTTRTLSLNDYEGQTIYIAFRNVSNDKFLLVIDNIFVRLPYERDIFVKSVDLDLSPVHSLNKNTTVFGTKKLKVNLLNFGSERITSMKVSYTLNGQKTEETLSSNFHSGETMVFESEEFHLPIGTSQIMDFDIVSVNGMSDQDGTNDNEIVQFDVQPTVPVYTFNDSKGRSVNLHNLLREGKTVLLNFFDSECFNCEESFNKLNQYYLATGAGNQDLEIVSIAMDPNDSNSILNNIGWSATFPLVQYFPYNEMVWVHYTKSLGLDPDARSPFFLQICPNPNNVAFSTISASSGYDNPNIFNELFRVQHTACQSGISDLSEIEALDDLKVYPNPNFDGEINLDIHLSEVAKIQIEITDMKGRIVSDLGILSLKSGKNSIKTDVSNLESGMYIIALTKGKEVSHIKLSVMN